MALAARGRVSAEVANRSAAHRCAACGDAVVLKRGRVVIAHFAHRARNACTWSNGETLAHMGAKLAMAAAFTARGLAAEVEAEVLSGAGDRRADVLVRQPSTGARVAIEIQHSPLGLDAVEHRTRAYLAAGVPVLWIATLDPARAPMRQVGPDLMVVDRYAAPDWQRFAAAYHGALWFWMKGKLWRGWLQPAWVARAAGGESSDHDWQASRRWMGLTLGGPFTPEATRIVLDTRDTEVHEDFVLPGGRRARLVCDGERAEDAMLTHPQWTDWSGQTKPKLQIETRAGAQVRVRLRSAMLGARA